MFRSFQACKQEKKEKRFLCCSLRYFIKERRVKTKLLTGLTGNNRSRVRLP